MPLCIRIYVCMYVVWIGLDFVVYLTFVFTKLYNHKKFRMIK